MRALKRNVHLPKLGISFDDVKEAAQNIGSYAHRTPVLTSESLNKLTGQNLFFKCENLQKSGAFKYRGATNAISKLTPAQLKKGVVTHSSGNHAGALTLAAKNFGTTAHIVMPSNASNIKKAAVKEYGGRIIECEPTLEARLAVSEKVQQETGATMIPPFNHRDVIAGQGTCALEFLRQVPNLDVLVVPVGGGGLIAGSCIAAKSISERIKIVGAEPSGADDAFRSKQKGELLPNKTTNTICDGLLTSLGQLTWPFINEVVNRIVTVDDTEIIAAMKLFMERTKLLLEPNCAVALAAVTSPQMLELPHTKNVGIIITGGNVDLENLPW